MTQSNNNFSYSYEDECILYKSLFPVFRREDFNELDKTYNKLDIDNEIEKLFSEYKINTTENQEDCIMYIEAHMESKLVMLALAFMK